MKKLALLAVLACGFGPEERGRFVAHEWGTFTSVAGADGRSLEWRPLLGPDDLPKFVYRMGTSLSRGPELAKAQLIAKVRMETPVIYFYSDTDVDVAVKVGFPQGKVTEWYPQATDVKQGVEWAKVRVRPGAEPAFLREKGESHYYPARETDAAPLSVELPGGRVEHEKLLFYRGVGWFEQPLRATLPGGRVLGLQNTGRWRVAEAFVFERSGSAVGWSRVAISEDGASVARPERTGTVQALERELGRALVASGLYPREAEAMLATWRDTWFEDGLRVLYLLPREATDAILPLALNPRPAELARTLVGRLEILTPEREQEVLGLVMRLAGAPQPVWERLREELRKQGRFLEPTLRRLRLSTQDPDLAKRLDQLILKGI
jgi:hypothetical protein